MANSNVHVSTGGISFFSLLAILFIGLKLTGYISWSWWWVLAPLWAPILLAILVAIILMIIAITAGVFSK